MDGGQRRDQAEGGDVSSRTALLEGRKASPEMPDCLSSF